MNIQAKRALAHNTEAAYYGALAARNHAMSKGLGGEVVEYWFAETKVRRAAFRKAVDALELAESSR